MTINPLPVIEMVRGDDHYTIDAKQYVFTAGEGTGDLMNRWQLDSPAMQLRPLHMVMVEHDFPHPVYAHCVSTDILPRLTMTSHPSESGRWVWYMGGELDGSWCEA